MRRWNRWSAALAVLAALVVGNGLRAAEPTTITVADMDCPGCAKQVAAKVSKVQGVAKVQTDVEAKTVTVTPRARVVLAPRALWEAVEKAGKQPTRLEGPSGTFTARPQS
jgi:Cu+-exporting ATPase